MLRRPLEVVDHRFGHPDPQRALAAGTAVLDLGEGAGIPRE
jgi:hypothetical protein